MTVAVYIIALLAYIAAGKLAMEAGLLLTMDSPSFPPTVIWVTLIVTLWVAGLVVGTAAYF